VADHDRAAQRLSGLSTMTDAASITWALGGRWHDSRGYGTARCPVHDDRTPSLSIRNGQGRDGTPVLLVKCFAGCDTQNVLAALRHRGLLPDYRHHRRKRFDHDRRDERNYVDHQDVPDAEALQVWGAALPGGGADLETYFRNRGIVIPVPLSLRFGSVLQFDGRPMPALVAAVQGQDRKIVAVQTTMLTTTGRKAAVLRPRNTMGALGVGAVRLAKAGTVLGLAEGVETALSAQQLTGVPCWACLGAGRMHHVAVPTNILELHVFGDNDEPGRAAAERTAHENRHRRVVLRFPPEGCKDWNDILVVGGGRRHD
jgi:putative DNA primase/helicase